MTTLRRITSLEGYEKAVALTAKKCIKGIPNPNYDKAVRKLEAARYHYDARNKIAKAAKKKGFVRNQYENTCNSRGVAVAAFAGFVKKNESGKWETFCWDYVVELLGVKIVDLPIIED